MKKYFILLSSLIGCIILFYVEQIIEVNYLIKTIGKVVLFTSIPYIYIRYIQKLTINNSIRLNKLDKKGIKLGVSFGIASFIIILLSYYFLSSFIDFQGIVNELETKSQITAGNFILVGLYITFGNSFLEEFFFRGFIFLNLYKLNYKKSAYIYSSILFALYHIAIFKTWFNIWLTGLALFSLVIIGFVFNWLNTKSGNFLNSWIVHILADSAIIIIGLRLFRLI